MTTADQAAQAIREALAAGPTPGPWQAEQASHKDDDGYPETPVVAPDVSAYVAVCVDFGPNNPGMRDANADYIAAASPAALVAILEEMDRLRKDAQRLDFVLKEGAFVVWSMRDGSIRQCQLMTQDEDEEYHWPAGEDRYFNTDREAIDAAIKENRA